MMKRKEFMLGAVAGLTVAAAATAGGVIDWPTATAEPIAGVSGRLTASAGAPGAAFAPPQGAPRSFADIFEQVAPAVVQINVEARITGDADGTIQIPGTPFRIPLPQPEEGEEAPTQRGAGSGFFISADGFIVTNNHVVADATEITVILTDGRELEARVVGRDPATDLAVLKVEGSDYPFVQFEEQAQPRVGDWVLAVGNPFQLGGTATAGIVSGLARQNIDPRQTGAYVDFLQIDAAINTGNSGGPTFDIYGRVIGVNTAIYSDRGGGSVGVGFAIPASIAKSITDQLVSGEEIERGYVGVTIAPINLNASQALGLPNARGAQVVDYLPGGPADQAGLRFGDVVTEIDGREVQSSTELTRTIAGISPGSRTRLTVLRGGRETTINLSPVRRPDEDEVGSGRNVKAAAERAAIRGLRSSGESVLGLTLADSSAAFRESAQIADRFVGPVIVAVAPSSAADAGVAPGMLMLAVNGQPVSSVAETRAAVAAARRTGRDKLLLLVGTPNGPSPLVLDFEEN